MAAVAVFLGLMARQNRHLREEIKIKRSAEEAPRRSETDYRALVESANSVILRMTPEGAVVFENRFAERFRGDAAGEIVNRNVVGTDMTVPRRAEEVLHRYDFIVNTGDDMQQLLDFGPGMR